MQNYADLPFFSGLFAKSVDKNTEMLKTYLIKWDKDSDFMAKKTFCNHIFTYFCTTITKDMKNRRPLIFISNDDGYLAGGINQLIQMVRPLGRIVVVAPDSARSGYSMAMTSDRPVTLTPVSLDDDVAIYRCSGTPTDCIKLAFHVLFGEEQPDLVLAGINHGDNASVNVHYSGTMAIVLEGCMKHIPSIGFSSCNTEKAALFKTYESVVVSLCRKVLEERLPDGVCLNVNFPASDEYKGVRVCRQDKGNWHQEWEVSVRKDGSRHYWLSGYYQSNEPEETESDRWGLEHGYVTVVPTTIDLTAYRFLADLKNWVIK